MKVWPRNDEIRKLLKHGVTPFPQEGPADWPDDTFTHRRIMDGDITTEDPAKKSTAERAPSVERAPAVEKKVEKPAPDVGKS